MVVVERSQVVKARSHVGMLRAERLFQSRQFPLVKRLGLRILALVIVERRLIVEARAHERVLRGP